MRVDYSRMGYEMGILTEPMLRGDILPALFRNNIGREWWRGSVSIWTGDQMLTRRDRRFAHIVNEELLKAAGKDEDRTTGAEVKRAEDNTRASENRGL